MCYILFLGANSRWLELSGKLVEGATAGDLYGTGQTIQLGFHVTEYGRVPGNDHRRTHCLGT